MRIVDTHCHTIDRVRLRYPWLGSVAGIDRDFMWPEYWRQAVQTGITEAIFIEVDVEPGDASREVNIARHFEPPLAGIVAGCRPEDPDFPERLERIDPGVKGLRRVLHTQPDELSQRPLFQSNLRRIGRHGLTFDLCVQSRQLPLAYALARSCPGVSFILDHCGNPPIWSGTLDQWRNDMTCLATLPNVCCKFSGIVTNAYPASWTVDDLRPVFDHVVAKFGAGRLLWGSDWPLLTLASNLGTWMAATHSLLQAASFDDKAAILGNNALRLYRLNVSEAPT